ALGTLLLAVMLGLAAAELPRAEPILASLIQLGGALGAAAILTVGWQGAAEEDRRFRRATLDLGVAWAALHLLRLIAAISGNSLPPELETALLAAVALLAARCWPVLLEGRTSRSEATAIVLDSAAVFAAVAAIV